MKNTDHTKELPCEKAAGTLNVRSGAYIADFSTAYGIWHKIREFFLTQDKKWWSSSLVLNQMKKTTMSYFDLLMVKRYLRQIFHV